MSGSVMSGVLRVPTKEVECVEVGWCASPEVSGYKCDPTYLDSINGLNNN